MGKIKIFLSYHKKSPLFKSEQFEPIGVGGYQGEDILSDNTGENISRLNSYYCEMTGQFWVLKNYLDNCNEDYIGFAHYRRLPDILNITQTDTPSIYGMNYSDSLKFFEKLNSKNLYEYCKNYDAIYPCRCYMYKNTVNPLLRDNEQNYNVYEHFKAAHNNNCLDILKKVIAENYPEYENSLLSVYESEKSLFYNIYIMKTPLIKDYLTWAFDVLKKVCNEIKKENNYQEKYKRMAGFVAETLMNVWLDKYKNLKTGYVPLYMIDFESEYIEKANKYSSQKDYHSEIKELEKLYEITSDKFNVLLATGRAYANLGEITKSEDLLIKAEGYAKTSEDYYELADLSVKNGIKIPEDIIKLFERAIKLSPDEKFYPQTLLRYTEKLHDIEKTKQAWDYMKKHILTPQEEEKYSQFKKICSMMEK